MSRRSRLILSAALLSFGPIVHAGTVAYWRFEGDGVNVPTAGVQVEDDNGRTTTATGEGIRAIDTSGNGNTLWAWEHAWAGHTYENNVYANTVPATGAPNNFSVRNAGDFPALHTWSEQSSPSFNVQTWAPTTWSMEVSFNLTSLNGWQTFIGRDGNNVRVGEAAHAPFYFQKMGDGSNRVRVVMVDSTGTAQTVIDPVGVTTDSWYNYAVTSDGSSLKLYRSGPNDAGAYVAVGTTSMTPGTSMITPGHYADGDMGNWAWTVGRGSYGTGLNYGDNHGDRVFGYLDEVRFSDTALAPEDFLWYTGVLPPVGRDLVWTGASSNVWDAGSSSNFTVSGGSTTFATNDRVTVNNNSPQTITLVGNLAMGGLTINGDADLTFDGDGALSGSGGLTKNGTGALIIRNTGANGFSGPIDINGGIVELTGDGTAATMIGSGDMALDGTLVLNRLNTVFVANNISGSGNIQVKNFAVLSGNNSYDGNVVVETNTLYLDSQNALGSTVGSTTVLSGGQIGIFLGNFTFNEAVSIEGLGVGTGGAIRTGGNRTVTFAGPLTINNTTSVFTDGGSTLRFTGAINPVGSVQFAKQGPGTLETVAFNADLLYLGEGTLRVASGTAKVQNITFDTTLENTLDVTRGTLAVDYAPGNSVYAELVGKIASADLINSLGTNYAVALIDNAARATPLTSIHGVNIDTSTVIVSGTLKGDINLDAAVGFDDLLILAQNYDAAGSGKTWDLGDGNYDGIVNFDDLLAMAQNYGLTALTADQASTLGEMFVSDFNLARALVPEPTALLAGLAIPALLVRRRA